jgi:peptide/nickel transport system substrate-binding protein/oligopeptide transport system substrate-binding protein
MNANKKASRGKNTFCFLLVIGFWILTLGFYSFAEAKEYDGIWFLAFNVQKAPFNNLLVREAVSHCIDRGYITKRIVGEEIIPGGIIPPGMPGFNPTLKPYKKNIKYAKSLMKKAKYSLNDRRLKTITLLHTDGENTIKIADKIKNDLKQLGMKVELVEVSYRDETRWTNELSSKTHQLFVMGYKAESNEEVTGEATPRPADTLSLLEPIFKTGGFANFNSYSDPKVDSLLQQLTMIDSALAKEREKKLLEINRLIYKELPVLILFYIEKL